MSAAVENAGVEIAMPLEQDKMAPLSIKSSDPAGYPDIPKPSNPSESLPRRSSSVLVSSMDVELWLQVWESKSGYARLRYGQSGAASDVFDPKPAFPRPSKLVYQRYWQNTGSFRVSGPQTFTKAINTTQGMGTNAGYLSRHLGVAHEGLSAKLSALTASSINVEEDKSVTQTYTFNVVAGKTAVCTVWQLMEQFSLTDSDMKPISWKGTALGFFHMGSRVHAEFRFNKFTNATAHYVADPVIF